MTLHTKRILTSVAFSMLVAAVVYAGNVTLPYAFTAGTTARAAEVNANFQAVKTAVDDNQAQITALKALAPLAFANINNVGTIRNARNVTSVTHTATGQWQVTLTNNPDTTTPSPVVATVYQGPVVATAQCTGTSVYVETRSLAGALVDADFSFIVYHP